MKLDQVILFAEEENLVNVPVSQTHPLQLDAEGLIPAQPADGRPARPADHSGVQPEHRADLH